MRGLVTGDLVVVVARPFEDRSGKLQAVLGTSTRLKRLQNVLRMDNLPAGSIVRIVDENGVIIAHSTDGPHWVGRDLSAEAGVKRQLAAKEASVVIEWTDGVTRITGSSTAHRVPWLVTVGLPTEVAFATVASRFGWSALFAALAGLLASLIAWMASGRIVRPLQQLGRDALVLAAGKLSHRSTVHTRDEVGMLSDAFNRMAEALEHRQGDALRASEQLRKANETIAAVIDASPMAIICSDFDRRILLWSRAAEQMFGHTAEEAIGVQTKLVPPEGRAESHALFERAVSGATVRDAQVKRLRKDGSLLDVRIAVAPLY